MSPHQRTQGQIGPGGFCRHGNLRSEGGGQQINCHNHTQQKLLFSHTDSSEPELQDHLMAPLVAGNMSRLKLHQGL